MPPFLLDLVIRLGVPEPFRRLVAWIFAAIGLVAIAVLIWLAFILWLGRHDKKVVTDDRNAANAEVTNRQIVAERAAGAAKEQRDDEFANNTAQIQEKTDEAARSGASPLDALLNQLR